MSSINFNKELIGLGNIVVSEIDGKIYINNFSQIEKSIKGSLGVYTLDNSSTLEGSGPDCVWDKDRSSLSVKNIVPQKISFLSNNSKELNSFTIATGINPKNQKDILAIDAFSLKNQSSKCIIYLDDQKVYFKETVNISKRKIISSIGEEGDLNGDIAFDENYIYYCIKDFDGQTKIWRRCSLSEW